MPLGDKYALGALLEESEFGSVWAADEQRTGRRTRVVLLQSAAPRELRIRLLEHGAGLQRRSHPNLAQVLDIGTSEDGEPYVVTEALVGPSLAERWEASPALRADRLLEIGVGILEGLTALHEITLPDGRSIVHGDVAPSNVVLVGASGREVPKLVGFPSIRALQIGDPRSQWRPGEALAYAAPEQAAGEVAGSATADLYSAAAIVFAGLSGRPPHVAADAESLAKRIASEAPPSIATLAEGLGPFAATLSRALAMDPKRRYPNGASLSLALRAVLSADRLVGSTLTPVGRRSAWVRQGAAAAPIPGSTRPPGPGAEPRTRSAALAPPKKSQVAEQRGENSTPPALELDAPFASAPSAFVLDAPFDEAHRASGSPSALEPAERRALLEGAGAPVEEELSSSALEPHSDRVGVRVVESASVLEGAPVEEELSSSALEPLSERAGVGVVEGAAVLEGAPVEEELSPSALEPLSEATASPAPVAEERVGASLPGSGLAASSVHGPRASVSDASKLAADERPVTSAAVESPIPRPSSPVALVRNTDEEETRAAPLAVPAAVVPAAAGGDVTPTAALELVEPTTQAHRRTGRSLARLLAAAATFVLLGALVWASSQEADGSQIAGQDMAPKTPDGLTKVLPPSLAHVSTSPPVSASEAATSDADDTAPGSVNAPGSARADHPPSAAQGSGPRAVRTPPAPRRPGAGPRGRRRSTEPDAVTRRTTVITDPGF
ncbi:MAG: protein kinase domain-containing protein [Deltaproteobacteria bacterium]